MRTILLVLLVAVAGAMAGCKEDKAAGMPAPFALTDSAIGHYCGMNLTEHEGPKGQIILSSRKEPVWFSSARDTLSFTMLPEEPKDIRAIYVSDMAKATSWQDPGATNWIDARKAVFVIKSRVKGGMGAPEAVPFSERAAAERFVAENGGRAVTFDQVPRSYILEAGEAPPPSVPSSHRH